MGPARSSMTGAHRSGDGGFGGDEGSKLTLIQQVATACRKVFKEMRGYSEDDIAEVKALLDRVGASDVGLGEKQRGKHQPQIEFVDVLDTPTFTIGIFILPKGRSLPLHDHPGMTVLSKVLYGSLLVSRFDKEDYSRPTDMTDFSEQFPVKVLSYRELVTDDQGCMTLMPRSKGNLHEFTANTDCAVIDILAPPYDFSGGRPCNYYRLLGVDSAAAASEEGQADPPSLAAGDRAYLLARDVPESFFTWRRQYAGPPLNDSG